MKQPSLQSSNADVRRILSFHGQARTGAQGNTGTMRDITGPTLGDLDCWEEIINGKTYTFCLEIEFPDDAPETSDQGNTGTMRDITLASTGTQGNTGGGSVGCVTVWTPWGWETICPPPPPPSNGPNLHGPWYFVKNV